MSCFKFNRTEPIDSLSDPEVLRVARSKMPPAEFAELCELQCDESEGQLDETGRKRLNQLMAEYRRIFLRKSEAFVVCRNRGILDRLTWDGPIWTNKAKQILRESKGR